MQAALVHDTIREINSIQHGPEFAAAIHKLETSTNQSSIAMDELKPGPILHTPVMPDPETFSKGGLSTLSPCKFGGYICNSDKQFKHFAIQPPWLTIATLVGDCHAG